MATCHDMPTLSAAEWQARASAHFERAKVHTGPARQRRDRGIPHPIADFLFDYYPYPFAFLEQWHPGIGTGIEWSHADAENPSLRHLCERWYRHENGVLIADASLMPEKEKQRLEWIVSLLEATRDRAPNFACHGLHEWAMVYGGQTIRHEKTLSLRLPQQEIDAFVSSRPICCSHHDAFRFFADEARPFNRLQPSLDTREKHEQPGCLHANMDLYKWAAKAMPWCGSDLLIDCFELAVRIRDLDMRASPYDLSAWGREAVCIETPEGRKEYENEQRALASEAQPLRERLIECIQRTLREHRTFKVQH
ncbi:MAG: 3-methyladenine DNA glycosylase [Luteolibacter sp.]